MVTRFGRVNGAQDGGLGTSERNASSRFRAVARADLRFRAIALASARSPAVERASDQRECGAEP